MPHAHHALAARGQQVLQGAASGRFDMQKVDLFLQYVNQAKRGCRQILKATQRLLEIRDTLQRDTEGYVIPASAAADAIAPEAEQSQLCNANGG